MPILQAETNLFPGSLLEAEFLESAENQERSWWVLHTLSRQEKQLMRKLLARQVPFYCPIIPKRHRSAGGRARTSHLPLFSNYVFAFADELERYEAIRSGCMAKALPVPGRQAERFVEQLRQIERLIAADLPLHAEARLQPGTRVRIRSGPFAGMVGTIFERRERSRLLIQIDFLQQGASVSLDDWDVERV